MTLDILVQVMAVAALIFVVIGIPGCIIGFLIGYIGDRMSR